MLPHINLFNHEISMYWLCYTAAALVAAGAAFAKRRAFGIGKWDLTQLLCLSYVSSILGAKILNAVLQIILHGTEPGFWTADTWKVIAKAGGVEYGAYLLGPLCVMLFAKLRGMDLRRVLDFSTYVILAYGPVASLGCFFAGCCYGIEVPWGIVFHESHFAPNGVPLLPAPLFASALYAVLLVAFLLLKPERKHPGVLFPLFLLTYCGVGRFAMEFIRGDSLERGIFLMFSFTQWIALAMIAAALFMLYRMKNPLQKQSNSVTIKAA